MTAAEEEEVDPDSGTREEEEEANPVAPDSWVERRERSVRSPQQRIAREGGTSCGCLTAVRVKKM